MITIGQWWMWLGFLCFVGAMLVIDMFFCGGKKAHRVSTKEALAWTGIWIFLAIFFNLLLWWYLSNTVSADIATKKSLEFFAGYLIEKSLSIDNVFVFLMIFSYFSVPLEFQRRVLLYGIVSAIVMRLVLILVGIWLITHFHWLLYVFGFFLLILAVKMIIFADRKSDLDKNPLLKWMRNHLRVTDGFEKERFFLKKGSFWFVTPLFIVLILIEATDLIFAVDSIPAVFAVTKDPFIVFTSNIFAMLGLRALYFLFANLVARFQYLKYGLAIILAFVGVKLLIAHWYKIHILVTLSFVGVVLLVSMLVSIYKAPPLKIKKS
jgi:tellurite resistance protein TerC